MFNTNCSTHAKPAPMSSQIVAGLGGTAVASEGVAATDIDVAFAADPDGGGGTGGGTAGEIGGTSSVVIAMAAGNAAPSGGCAGSNKTSAFSTAASRADSE